MKDEAQSITAKEIREKYDVILESIPRADQLSPEEFDAIQLYLARLKLIELRKRRGDMKLIGEMLGITADYADKSFNRLSSRHHIEVVDALEEIIANREMLLQKNKITRIK